jgi:hypothetical protein
MEIITETTPSSSVDESTGAKTTMVAETTSISGRENTEYGCIP